jgi:hypothetical protein
MKTPIIILLAVGLSALAVGCKPSGSDYQNTTNTASANEPTAKYYANAAVTNTAAATTQAWAEMKADFQSAMGYSYDRKDEFVAKTKADLKVLDEKIQDLSDRAATASETTRADLQVKLQELRAKRGGLDQRLNRLKNATEEEWSAAKEGFQNAYDDVKTSVTNAWHSMTGN